MTRQKRLLARCAMGAALGFTLVGGLSTAASAQSVHLGPRMGYDFDAEDIFFGMQLSVPVGKRLEFAPSMDVYTPNTGSLYGLNGDLKYRMPTVGGPDFYAGGGLNILRRSVNDVRNSDVGANAFFGVEGRSGWVHPFAEARVLLNDNTRFQLGWGLNLTVGR